MKVFPGPPSFILFWALVSAAAAAAAAAASIAATFVSQNPE